MIRKVGKGKSLITVDFYIFLHIEPFTFNFKKTLKCKFHSIFTGTFLERIWPNWGIHSLTFVFPGLDIKRY